MYQPRVFVSHRSGDPDTKFANDIAQSLSAEGARVWVDIDSLKGSPVDTTIEDALDNCDWFVLVLTPRATEQQAFVRDEVAAALALQNMERLQMIFVECAKIQRVPLGWGRVRRLDATDGLDPALTELKRLIWDKVEPQVLPRGIGYHATIPLNEGSFLVAGGVSGEANTLMYLDDAYMYQAESGSWKALEHLHFRRAQAAGAQTSPSSAVIVGGAIGSNLVGAHESFDCRLGRFSISPLALARRCGHTCTPLSDGRVVVIGGVENAHAMLLVEIVNPRSNAVDRLDDFPLPISQHAAVSLPSGQILVIGGNQGQGADRWTGLYAPQLGGLRAGPQLIERRQDHAAVLLDNGSTIVVFGGRNEAGVLSSVEVLDLKTGAVELGPNMEVPRYGLSAVSLGQNTVVLVGGFDTGGSTIRTVEVFDVQARAFVSSYKAASIMPKEP